MKCFALLLLFVASSLLKRPEYPIEYWRIYISNRTQAKARFEKVLAKKEPPLPDHYFRLMYRGMELATGTAGKQTGWYITQGYDEYYDQELPIKSDYGIIFSVPTKDAPDYVGVPIKYSEVMRLMAHEQGWSSSSSNIIDKNKPKSCVYFEIAVRPKVWKDYNAGVKYIYQFIDSFKQRIPPKYDEKIGEYLRLDTTKPVGYQWSDLQKFILQDLPGHKFLEKHLNPDGWKPTDPQPAWWDAPIPVVDELMPFLDFNPEQKKMSTGGVYDQKEARYTAKYSEVVKLFVSSLKRLSSFADVKMKEGMEYQAKAAFIMTVMYRARIDDKTTAKKTITTTVSSTTTGNKWKLWIGAGAIVLAGSGAIWALSKSFESNHSVKPGLNITSTVLPTITDSPKSDWIIASVVVVISLVALVAVYLWYGRRRSSQVDSEAANSPAEKSIIYVDVAKSAIEAGYIPDKRLKPKALKKKKKLHEQFSSVLGSSVVSSGVTPTSTGLVLSTAFTATTPTGPKKEANKAKPAKQNQTSSAVVGSSAVSSGVTPTSTGLVLSTAFTATKPTGPKKEANKAKPSLLGANKKGNK